MSKIFDFENKYEIQFFDSWKLAIKKMNSYSVRKRYFPHNMEQHEERIKKFESVKSKFMTLYKDAYILFNKYHLLEKYFTDEIRKDLKEKNENVRLEMKKTISHLEQDDFDKNFNELITSEKYYFDNLCTVFEAAYMQWQAERTMEAAHSILRLKNTEIAKKERKRVRTAKLANTIIRRSKRIQEQNK